MNEEESIGKVLDDIRLAMGSAQYEILIVDTNSQDRTVEIAKSKGARVVSEPRLGYGRAYKTGFEKADGEIIATLDADCSYPPERIPQLVRLLEEEDIDFISGDRLTLLSKDVMSKLHRTGNWILNFTIRLLFFLRMKDSQSGMWVFRKAILPKLHLTSDGMPFSEELKVEVHQRGFRLKEFPIEYRARTGKPKLKSWVDGFNNFRFLFKKRFKG